MPRRFHRMVDSSVFLEPLLERDRPARRSSVSGSAKTTCQEHIETTCSNDTLLCDLVLGEVVKRLREEIDVEPNLMAAVGTFFGWIRLFRVEPLLDDTFRLFHLQEIQELRVNWKDKLLIAFAVAHGLTQFSTLDSGIRNEQRSIREISSEHGGCELHVEFLGAVH
jgi:predicted nucleic acid-binding protein